MGKKIELVCPAGTPAALRAAIDAGADAVYVGFRNETNARNFPGLNFSESELYEAIGYARECDRKVYVAINTFQRPGSEHVWHNAVEAAAELGASAVILADIGLMDHAAHEYPSLRLHLSVQAGASHADAIRYYYDAFGIQRVVLPRVLTINEIAALNQSVPVETEVFAFGGMCPMAEGRCSLSSYITGQSPNLTGVCSPASHVRYEWRGDHLVSILGGSVINKFASYEMAGYPTLCKGRFSTDGDASYIFEEPTSLNTADVLSDLIAAGVTALKIEGRQRGRAYITSVVSSFRKLIDALASDEPSPSGIVRDLRGMAEGQCGTAGAYARSWR